MHSDQRLMSSVKQSGDIPSHLKKLIKEAESELTIKNDGKLPEKP